MLYSVNDQHLAGEQREPYGLGKQRLGEEQRRQMEYRTQRMTDFVTARGRKLSEPSSLSSRGLLSVPLCVTTAFVLFILFSFLLIKSFPFTLTLAF